jgi:hypothetical protein
MDAEPVTLGEWYEVLNPSDYVEVARLANKGQSPEPWLPIFFRNWAPELINSRRKWETASTRTDIAERLAKIERFAQHLADALDPEVIEFLELPPHGHFQNRLGTRILALLWQISTIDWRNRIPESDFQ